MKIPRKMTVLLLFSGLLIWMAFDLAWPLKSDLTQFDCAVIARLDTEMWRSYYQRQPLKLFFKLTKTIRSQFHAPFWRSLVIAYLGARAAFVFKKGKNRADYNQALPALRRYYGWLRYGSQQKFEVEKAAKLELEWWIVHRQRTQYSQTDLVAALANSAAAIYQKPSNSFENYGIYRAKAMEIRDQEAERDGVSEAEWASIGELLRESWGALSQSVSKH